MTGTEALARDWASGNGIKADPAIEELPMQPGDPTVTTRTCTALGRHPVTLYRIDGGGHGWQAALSYATGILLGMAEREDGANAGRRILGPGGHL